MKSNQNHKRIAVAFDRLFRTYPQFGQGSTPEEITLDRVEKAKVYFDAVVMYDEQDVETAVANFLAGHAPGHNPSFAPPAPLVGAETRRVMTLRLESEHRDRQMRPALPPPDIVHTPDSQARVREMMASVTQKIVEPATAEAQEADRRHKEQWANVNARFMPDMSEDATAERLGVRYTAGDEEGEAA